MVNTYFKPYLKVARDCGTEENDDCAIIAKQRDGTDLKVNDGRYKLFLQDGTQLAITQLQSGTYWESVSIYVDLNGKKEPNICGKDIFRFDIVPSQNKVVPAGYGSTYENNKRYCEAYGNSCAGLIAKDGWQIKYDW